VLIRLRLLFNR